MNENWVRWVYSSIIIAVQTAIDAYNTTNPTLTLYVEGRQRLPDPQPVPRIELRIDGPDIIEVSSGCWNLHVEVNLLVTGIINTIDVYAQQRLMGLGTSILSNSITINEYGDGNSMLGCLILQTPPKGDGIIVSNFGLIESERNIFQSTVEAQYKMTLTT